MTVIVSTATRGEVVLARAHGRLDAAGAATLHGVLTDLALDGPAPGTVILDLRDVDTLSRTAAGVLVRAQDTFTDRQQDLVLVYGPGEVRASLRSLGLAGHFAAAARPEQAGWSTPASSRALAGALQAFPRSV